MPHSSNPPGKRLHRAHALQRLIRLAKKAAVQERLSMPDAARQVMNREGALAADAAGLSGRSMRPSWRTLRKHLDPNRIKYAQTWPASLPPCMSKDEAYYWLEPYIPVSRRPSRKQEHRKGAALLIAEGFPHKLVSALTGIPLSTLYRHRPRRPARRPL